MSTQTLTVKLLPVQKQFLAAKEKELLLSGAWGGAKSSALCWKVLKEATIDGAEIMLCRKTYTSLKRSTLVTLLGIAPKNSYHYNKIDQTIKLNGYTSTIYLMGLDDMNKIGSMNVSMIAVDEASELIEEEWMALLGRIRKDVGCRQLCGATNPASPSHFLYKRFFADKNINRRVIRSKSYENPYLPKDYLDSLKELPKHLYDRFVEGEWLALEKAIYSEWNREKHIKSRQLGEFNSYVVGVDFGFTNPCAVTLWGIDGDKNMHLIEEFKRSGMLVSKIADKVQRYEKLEPVIVVDPSAPALIAELKQRGLNADSAENDVEDGIAKIQDYLGRKKLTIDPKATEFVKEIENYARDDNGKPIKIDDHLVDSARYAIHHVVPNEVLKNKPFIMDFNEQDDDEEDLVSERKLII
jgi:PBSX family phage terminase large subunit